MIALQIPEVKKCMQLLLMEEAFDSFLFSEGTLALETTYRLDGKINTAYYNTEELAELGLEEQVYLPWRLMKARVFSLIRGNRTPQSFRFTLVFSSREARSLGAEDRDQCLLSLRFQENRLTMVTGLSRGSFSMDHALDRSWDDYARGLLHRLGIIVEEIG